MIYARYGPESDVYVLLVEGEKRHLHCCHTDRREHCYHALTTSQMIDHLAMHLGRGELVNWRVLSRLELDREPIDKWITGEHRQWVGAHARA